MLYGKKGKKGEKKRKKNYYTLCYTVMFFKSYVLGIFSSRDYLSPLRFVASIFRRNTSLKSCVHGNSKTLAAIKPYRAKCWRAQVCVIFGKDLSSRIQPLRERHNSI